MVGLKMEMICEGKKDLDDDIEELPCRSDRCDLQTRIRHLLFFDSIISGSESISDLSTLDLSLRYEICRSPFPSDRD